MNKLLVIFSLILSFELGYADGFNCQTIEKDLDIKVYNKVNPSEGTRNVAIMVISDPTIKYGRRTIARFKAEDGTLKNLGSFYVSKEDLRFADSSRGGENISGTKLSQLDQIILDVDFSYATPVEEGEELPATLFLKKRNGDCIVRELICERYLKN